MRIISLKILEKIREFFPEIVVATLKDLCVYLRWNMTGYQRGADFRRIVLY